ncbi:MAG TPA: ATP-binding protein [Myxococcales bacterium]
MELPLGLKEDLHLEFKAAAALRDPANIAREIVGFLNTDGGSLWIGVTEKDAIANSVEAVEDVERERARLQNAVVDLIEPPPVIGSDVLIDVEPLAAAPNRGVLCIQVKRGRQGPYALRRQSGRAFLRRTGSRLREMTREEIAAAFVSVTDTQQDATETVRKSLTQRMRTWADDATVAGLRIIVQPSAPIRLSLKGETLEPLLRHPQLTGNRPLGWNFTSNYSQPKPTLPNGWRFGESGKVQWLTIHENGGIEFSAVLERLHWRGEPDELWPFALIELPVSIVRLARTLYANHATRPLEPETKILLAMGVFQIGEWRLAPFSPASIGYQMARPKKFVEISQQPHFFTDPPIEVTWQELHASPDRSAYPLIRQLYRAFEYDEEQIPQEYNAAQGQLRFPQ